MTSVLSWCWHLLIVFLIQIDIFLVVGMVSTFLLCPEHFGYYIRRLWILFKSSVLTDLLWHCIGQRREMSACNFLVWVEIQVPHYASFDTPCEQERTLHYCCAGIDSPPGLHWYRLGWKIEECLIIILHLASTDVMGDGEEGNTLPLEDGQSSGFPISLLWHHPGSGAGVPNYSLAREKV